MSRSAWIPWAALGLVLAGCSQKPPTSLGPPVAEDLFCASCASACEEANQMRAVAIQMIRAECSESCRADWALPWVADRQAWSAHQGQRARVGGRILAREGGLSLRLEDGLELRVLGPITLRPPGAEARVVLVGALGEGELSDVRYAVSAF